MGVSGRPRLQPLASLLPPAGVNVVMPAQPSMPPLSSTQLQIDPALHEFQLVDLSRRFLVHDSFWALPEQFLGNKVRGLGCRPGWRKNPRGLCSLCSWWTARQTWGERCCCAPMQPPVAVAQPFRAGPLPGTAGLGRRAGLLSSQEPSLTAPPCLGWVLCLRTGFPGHPVHCMFPHPAMDQTP